MGFISFIKNLFTLGGEDRKFIKETDKFIEQSRKEIEELEAEYERLCQIKD